MPVVMRFNGTTIVHEVVPWPAECKLAPRDPSTMTRAEQMAELRLLATMREEDLHRAACVNPSCPARRNRS
jgi:hypothetical protein